MSGLGVQYFDLQSALVWRDTPAVAHSPLGQWDTGHGSMLVPHAATHALINNEGVSSIICTGEINHRHNFLVGYKNNWKSTYVDTIT